jgi:cobalt-zinc-cadmium efflux system membrane fusion protein
MVGLIILAVVLSVMLRRKPADAPDKETTETMSDVVELSPDAQRNTGIEIAPVAERTLSSVIETTGTILPDEARVAHITPLGRGIVQKIFVKLGDRVAQHQPLVQYDNIEVGELSGEYRRLIAQLNKEKAQSAVASRSLERAKSLIQDEAISQRELDVRQAEYEQAEAAVTSAQADLAAVEQKLRRYGITGAALRAETVEVVLRAPFAGVIIKFSIAPGIQVSPENELFTIVDTSSVWAVADVFEKDVASVAARGACTVSVPSYPSNFQGKVAYVSDYLDPSTRTSKVRCIVPNRDGRLKLDMYATVRIPGSHNRTALAIPSGAIQELEGKQLAFVQRDATHFERRELKLGDSSGQWVEVKDGVSAGEKVVSRGAFYLKSVLQKEKLKEEE